MQAVYVAETGELIDYLLRTCRKGDLVLFMSSADFSPVIHQFAAALKRDS